MRRQTEMHQAALKRPDGSQISTIRTYAIGTQSHCLDDDQDVAGALTILMQLLIDEASNRRFKKFNRTGIVFDVWKLILSFNLIPGATYVKSLIPGGLDSPGTFCIEPIEQLGAVAIALRKPSLFPVIKNSDAVIEAVLHGDEEMVLKMVAADPRCLTRVGTAIDLQGNSFTGTPFQAALHTSDVQLCEKMKSTFSQINHGQMEMERQFREIYKNSLRMYFEKQEAEIEYLKSLKNERQEVDHLIARAHYRSNLYLTALRSDDINLILKTHDQAQEDNAFDFTPYVYAIVNATQAELDDAINLVNAGPTETADARQKPFDQLTLVEKLNRFREEFVFHTQQEIIFNSNHILTGLKHNEKTWDEVDTNRITDPGYKKRIVIFSQLVGWSQRNAAEPVRQDIRQGTYYLTTDTEQKEPRSRPSRFNDWNSTQGFGRNSVVDAALIAAAVIDGIGYKFGAGGGWVERCGRHAARWCRSCGWSVFQNLCRTKTWSLENLCSQRNHISLAAVR
ncbi:MAG: hypothetical protein Q8L78_00660 [Coxiellaceae bacterium]|nr:hypothetical protein [Coxiellaceae bacterium]